MESKLFEIAARGTNIPVMATADPFKQEIHELQVAHRYVNQHFDDLEPGAVLDVDYIEGRREKPRKPDRFWTEEDEDDG